MQRLVTSLAALVAASVLATAAVAQPAPTAEEPTKEKKKKKKPKVKVSGFLAVYYKFRIDDNGDGTREAGLFRLAKSRIRVSGWVSDRAGYVVEADPRSPTILGVMRDAYLKLKLIPRHEIRLGQQKTQFGWENNVSSTRLYTVTRSELAEGLGRGVTLRDIGIGVIGHWPLTGGLRLEDAVTVVNGAGFGVQADDTKRKNVWGRVGLRYDDADRALWVRFGISGATGDQLTEADPGPPPVAPERFTFLRAGADLEVDHPWFFFAAEYAYGDDDGEASMAYLVELVGKTRWQVGPVVRYDAFDGEEYSRITAGAYWGLPDQPFRVIVHYEHFDDEAGSHDSRVTSQALVRF